MSAYHTMSVLFVPALFLCMLALLSAGHHIGRRRMATESEHERVGLVSIETAIFGLLGLMFAFTYSGAAQRFEQRRALAIQEANAVGTAWLRLDLLPASAQPPIREEFRRYARLHVEAYEALPDYDAFSAKLGQAKVMQIALWAAAVRALPEAPPVATQLLLPALNDMIDVTGTREALTRVHTPGAIVGCLAALALFSSLLAGYGLAGSRSWSRYLHMMGFAVAVAGTIYLVLDYDHPRFGLIRVDFADEALAAAVAGMK